MNLYLDIETIGTTDPEAIADIAAGISHPKTMSKPDTIAKWVAEEKPAVVQEAVKRTSFDGTYGQVITIGYAMDDGEVEAVYQGDGISERDILVLFADDVNRIMDRASTRPVLVGHNIHGFDLRFLWQRYIINGVKPPPLPFQSKAWDANINDTMVMWNPEREKRISLDKLCKALKIKSSKDGFDGSMVWDAFKAGEFDKIADYCKADVEAVRQCHTRMVA